MKCCRPDLARVLLATLCLLPLSARHVCAQSFDCDPERFALAHDGSEPNEYTSDPALSRDGRFLAFASYASNLVPGDNNGDTDIFVIDRLTGDVELVSKSSAGVQGNRSSGFPSLSADGRFVLFESESSTLHPQDTDARADIYLHDRLFGTTDLVSLSSTGIKADRRCEEPEISADGRFAVFSSAAKNLVSGDSGYRDIFLRDFEAATTVLVSRNALGVKANDHSWAPAIAADGRSVAFETSASNMISGGANGWTQVYHKDVVTGTVTLVSKSSAGVLATDDCWEAEMSADGRLVTFLTHAPNLVSGDGNSTADVFLHELATGITSRVSIDSSGVEGDDESLDCQLSEDGARIVFWSKASNLVPGDTNGKDDVFLHDRSSGETILLSDGPAGVPGDGVAWQGAISLDGQQVAFTSTSGNLVPTDNHSLSEIFGVNCASGGVPYCTAKLNSQGCVPSITSTGWPSAAGMGAFEIAATQVLSNKNAILLYGFGESNVPFQGGTLCVRPPLTRTGVIFSGGNPPREDCSGRLSVEFNAVAAGDGSIIAGITVFAQFWYRDPAASFAFGLTDALRFVMGL